MDKAWTIVRRIFAALILASFVFCTLGCTYVDMPGLSIGGDVPDVTPVSPDGAVHTSGVITEPEETDREHDETEPTETQNLPVEPPIDLTVPAETHEVVAPEGVFDGYDVIQRLEKLFNEDAPLKWKENLDEDGDGLPDETAAPDRQFLNVKDETNETVETDEAVKEPEKQYIQVYPEVLGYAYLDLTTGVSVTYNADTVYYSASLVKAAYIYMVLCEIEEFEALEHEYDDDGMIIYSDSERKYDLTDAWIYDEETMFKAGSGEIRNMESGTELTWIELFEYALVYSDNIAFAQIAERFGYNVYYSNAWEIGIDGMSEGFMRLTANDCARIMRAIYEYFESGSDYALMMKDWMKRSLNGYMIANRYHGIDVPHKYGWDIGAYHDMAIIYDEHPYIIVLLTDYDDGGYEENKFFGDVVALTREIHVIVHGGDTDGE